MNATGKRVFVLPLMVDFNYLLIFHERHARFVAVRGDH